MQNLENQRIFPFFCIFDQLWIITLATFFDDSTWDLTVSLFVPFSWYFEVHMIFLCSEVSNEDLLFLTFTTWISWKTANFKWNFLIDGKRYLTFQVDFLKGQTMNFQPYCKHFWRFSLLLSVKSCWNIEGSKSFCKFFYQLMTVIRQS